MDDRLTKSFFVKQMGHLELRIDGVDARMNSLQERLESRIEFARQDAKEHMDSVGRGITTRLGRLETRVDVFHHELKQDIHLTQQAIRATRDELKTTEQNLSTKIDRVAQKVDRHDVDIAALKEARLTS